MSEVTGHVNRKIVSIRALNKILRSETHKDSKIVWTNGSFDLFHIGHVRFLTYAKSLGTLLIVGLNGDGLVKEYKGRLHPIIPESQRAEVLSAIEVVDYVVIVSDYLAPIKLLKPDVFLKGEDYAKQKLPEEAIVTSYCGKVVVGHYTKGISTLSIVNRIIGRFSPKNVTHHRT